MTPIHTIKNDFDIIISKLQDDTSSSISFKMLASKTLILGCASYLESVITEIVVIELNVLKNDRCPAFNFAKNQGVNRKYHTWFDWKKSNAVDFYAQFGHEFKSFSISFMKENNRQQSELSFMSIGSSRNLLIHNNFLGQTINDDYDTVFTKCVYAMQYPQHLRDLFHEFNNSAIAKVV